MHYERMTFREVVLSQIKTEKQLKGGCVNEQTLSRDHLSVIYTIITTLAADYTTRHVQDCNYTFPLNRQPVYFAVFVLTTHYVLKAKIYSSFRGARGNPPQECSGLPFQIYETTCRLTFN